MNGREAREKFKYLLKWRLERAKGREGKVEKGGEGKAELDQRILQETSRRIHIYL